MRALTPIRAVADFFGIPISTLHYWERYGLITAHRRSGRRCFDEDQLYRISLVQLLQSTALMSLDEISSVLDARTDDSWKPGIQVRIDVIDTRLEALATARNYLGHLLECSSATGLEGCQRFRQSVALPKETIQRPR